MNVALHVNLRRHQNLLCPFIKKFYKKQTVFILNLRKQIQYNYLDSRHKTFSCVQVSDVNRMIKTSTFSLCVNNILTLSKILFCCHKSQVNNLFLLIILISHYNVFKFMILRINLTYVPIGTSRLNASVHKFRKARH